VGIAKRLADIASAISGDLKEKAEAAINKGHTRLESELSDWEKNHQKGEEKESASGAGQKNEITQIEEDLHVLGLKSGASWVEIKKAYRRESKKYHADLHQNDDEKKKVAHEIMLIFNTAYDRLEKHYRQK